jgi:hypothetical protein
LKNFIYISHRGNLDGRNPEKENHQDYIDYALNSNYMAEIDLWSKNEKLFLGHDFPQYEVDLSWLKTRKDYLWIHCKNTEAFDKMLRENLHCFFHNIDDYTITSLGYVWAYPGKNAAGSNCIEVMPELSRPIDSFYEKSSFHGVCSDYVKILNNR